MIDRYCRTPMKGLFETEHRLKTWLAVERAAAGILSRHGKIDPQGAKAVIETPVTIDTPGWRRSRPRPAMT